MLTVRANSQQEGSDTSPSTQVVFTMDSGRVLVNGAVYKGMSITKVIVPYPTPGRLHAHAYLLAAGGLVACIAVQIQQMRGDEKRPG